MLLKIDAPAVQALAAAKVTLPSGPIGRGHVCTYLSPMDPQSVREMALDMPGTAEKDHFGRPSYSVKKKIYMTLWIDDHRAVLKLTPDQQSALCEEMVALSPVPNKWGKHGWTNVDLGSIDERRFRFLLDLAWRNVSPKWLLPTRAMPRKCERQH